MQQTALSPDQKRLLSQMRKINYGSFLDFEVRDGVLIFPEHVRTTRELFCDGRHRRIREWDDETHACWLEVADLFAQFEADRNIKIERLRFADGVPTEIDYIVDEAALFGGDS